MPSPPTPATGAMEPCAHRPRMRPLGWPNGRRSYSSLEVAVALALTASPLVAVSCNALTGAGDVQVGGDHAGAGAMAQGGTGTGFAPTGGTMTTSSTTSDGGTGTGTGQIGGGGEGGAGGGPTGGTGQGGDPEGGAGGTDDPLWVENCPLNPEPPNSGTSCGATFDLQQVIFNSAESEVKGWTETATLTVNWMDRPSRRISYTYDMNLTWPNFSDTVQVNGNVHMIACVNGQWFGGSWDWMRHGADYSSGRQLEPLVPFDRIGCQTQNGALNGHQMRPGDPVGFMVTGLSRAPAWRNVYERSNIVMTVWP